MWAVLPLVATVGLPGLRAVQERPELSGPTHHVDLDGFRVHWTAEGADAPDAVDLDLNGLPDTIDAFAAGLVGGRDAFVTEGWRALADDDGAGGSPAIDVYVLDLDIFGYATTWPAADGDGWSCFIQLDASTTVGGRVAESVALHELHHCVQFRYTAQTDGWVYEAAATYEQYTHVVDPILDFAIGLLYTTRLGAPQRPLGDTGDRFEYAGALFMKFWSEWKGLERERLPRLWEALRDDPDWTAAFDAAAHQEFGVGLDRTFLEHAVWNGLACDADDGAHYRSDVLPCIAEVTVPALISGPDGDSIRTDDGPFTAVYLEAPQPDRAQALVCQQVDGVALIAHAAGGSTEVQASLSSQVLWSERAAQLRAVVIGTHAPLDGRCAWVPSAPTPPPNRGCASASRASTWMRAWAKVPGRRRPL